MTMWEEVEEILKKHYQGDDLLELLRRANQLVAPIPEIERPSGRDGWIVSQILRLASEELCPLSAAYSGFQLGVCYERVRREQEDAG